jgi:tRNA threonylcarbamoyladenosine biosynthesis protein TsaB
MSKILSIETFSRVCAVAVHEGGRLLGSISLHQGNLHGQKLVPLIGTLLDQLSLNLTELDAIAVVKGPGSYTGLRIGVSTAKGLCYAHDLPLLGIDSLDAYALPTKHMLQEGDVSVPMIDARRMEVYTKVLDHTWKEEQKLTPMIIDQASFITFLERGRVFFTGDSNEKVAKVISHPNALFIEKLESVDSVGQLAHEAFKEKRFEDLAYFEPNYPKAFLVKKAKNPLLQ